MFVMKPDGVAELDEFQKNEVIVGVLRVDLKEAGRYHFECSSLHGGPAEDGTPAAARSAGFLLGFVEIELMLQDPSY